MGFPRHSLSPAELTSLLETERKGGAFLAYRDGAGDLRLGPLDGVTTVTLGRGEDNDFELDWDAEVSRTHAQLVLIGGEWTIVDDGLSDELECHGSQPRRRAAAPILPRGVEFSTPPRVPPPQIPAAGGARLSALNRSWPPSAPARRRAPGGTPARR